MKYYMAPLEGITTYIFRQVYHRHYADFDKYFTPFLASKELSRKEKNEIDPEKNEGINLVPQILSNNPETFLSIAKQLKDCGYETVNLNLGCPSGTVVPRKRGAGMLTDTYALDRFFEEIFEKCPTKISVKTRIGMCDECEWEDILEVYKKYPFEELIIHPRLRDDWYTGPIRTDSFKMAYDSQLAYPLCYNGEVTDVSSRDDVIKLFPDVDSIMIGRGILKNPALLENLKYADPDGTADANDTLAKLSEKTSERLSERAADSDRLSDFIFDLTDSYAGLYGKGQDKNVLFKLKDIWTFIGMGYPEHEKALKEIKKAESISEFKLATKRFLKEVYTENNYVGC